MEQQQIKDVPVQYPVEVVPGTIIVPGWMSTKEFFKMQYDFLIKMRDDRLDHAAELKDVGLEMSYRMAASDMDFAAEVVKTLGQAIGIDVTRKS